jgi:hypothetical protein
MNEPIFSKEVDPEDPLQLEAALVEGEPLLMLDSLIEEYALQGLDSSEILQLFENPFFLATHSLMQQMGKPFIQRRIEGILERIKGVHFKVLLKEEKVNCSECSLKSNISPL